MGMQMSVSITTSKWEIKDRIVTLHTTLLDQIIGV